MKLLFPSLLLVATALALPGQTTPAAGVAPSGTATPRSNTRVDRNSASGATNAAAANPDPSNGRGRTDAARQNAVSAPGSATTARSSDEGATTDAPLVGNGATVHVPEQPPQLLLDVQPPSPGPNYIWAPGNYVWRNHQWQWMSGRWVVPPRPGLTWYSGTYDGRTQTWTEGRWGTDPSPAPSEEAPAASAQTPARGRGSRGR
jgi:hypothetical protein